MKNQLRFIISLFGDRHANMLLPLLYSIGKSNPDASTSIYWEDINEASIRLLSQAFPRVEFIRTSFDFSTDITRRISSKTLVWEQAAHEKRNDSGWLLFLDADTLVLKDISPFLAPMDADGILTYRDGKFPINSGVVVFRAGEKTAEFFSLWRKKTTEILNTPALYEQANNKALPYGGADQMAIHLLLGYRLDTREYTLLIGTDVLRLRTEHCEYLNETFSVPITDRTHIIHYKGGWRSILFEGSPFTKNRPKDASWEMFVRYHKVFREALSLLNKKSEKHFTPKDFGLTTPWYFDQRTLSERNGLYQFYQVIWQIKNFFPRLKRYIIDRFPTSR